MNIFLRRFLSSFLLLLLLWPVATVRADSSIKILIHNYQTWWEYRLDVETQNVSLGSHGSWESDEDCAHKIGVFYREHDDLWEARGKARDYVNMPPNVDNPESKKFAWIDLSPDCKFAFVGDESIVWPKSNGILGRRIPWTPVAEFKELKNWAIEDIGWSADSQFLVVLESRQRFSHSLLGIAGRSVPLHTFFVTTVNTTTGMRRRIKIIKDVRYGSAYVYGAESKCPREKGPDPVFGGRGSEREMPH